MTQDKIIVCQDCQQEFVFTKGEQEFYAEKELGDPIRCMVCRGIFKAAKEDKFRGQVKPRG